MNLKSDELKQLAHKEMGVLRQELHDIKECQFRFLSTTTILTGFLVSLPQVFGKVEITKDEIHSPVYLAGLLALLVLLPAWWIFFDKAKTVTRIVGYYRILEAVTRGEFTPRRFLGWERSLEIFRRARLESSLGKFIEDNGLGAELSEDERQHLKIRPLPTLRRRASTAASRFFRVFFLLQSQRYWLIAYDTFAILSFISLSIPIFVLTTKPHPFLVHRGQWTVVLVAVISVLWCCIANARVLTDLMWGQYSYTINHLIWIRIMADDGCARDEGPAEKYGAGPGTRRRE